MASAALALVAATASCGAGGAGPRGLGPAAVGTTDIPAAGREATAFAVRRTTLVFVDRRRSIRFRDGSTAARRIVTEVRYPDSRSAAEPTPRPLLLFAHGFAIRPSAYRRLLHSWTRAGFVVAAPTFPGESPDARGGPDRSDLLEEPADIRFVLARLLRASASPSGVLHGRIDGSRIAVAGHSDGGDAALAVAYDPRYRSRRITAAVILAGADLPGVPAFRFPSDGPPLLAVQGASDRMNPPADTMAFFRRARRPKMLVWMPAAGHYRPYMSPKARQFAVVARVTRAFLWRSTAGRPVSWRRIVALGRLPGVSDVRATPRS